MACAAVIHRLSAAATFAASHHPLILSPKLDTVMLFGFLAAFAVATCYLHRHDGRIGMFAFAASLAATGVYGFVEGVWPLGLLETAGALEAARRGLQMQGSKRKGVASSSVFVADLEGRHARYREIFGSN